ncbi:unnamed protein product [Brachionus calyciflorus]|uniref:MULE domain-containing protein n=1 Tax=Brachionus calyciflorus TaxID=104777 RepID=A0A814M1Q4_9BILA|nr:unnamed protein product [Brachionus calyciflorus]
MALNEKLTTTTNNLLKVNANCGHGLRGSRGQRGGRVGRGRGRGVSNNTEPTSLTVVFQDLTLNIDTIGNDYCKLIENFLTYFVDTWFEGNFESKLWNHANTIDPRTNNHVEGFHNKLNKWIAKPHPNIYQLISVFQKINTKISVDYEFRLLGKSGPKRRAIDVEKDNRYQNLLENLEMNVIDLQQYLRSCSFLVNFNSIMNMV